MSESQGHVVVVGCGRVGAGFASRLVDDGFSVAVIDKRVGAFDRLGDVSADRIQGVGFDSETLVRAGIKQAKALAAVTSGDNSNIVIARVARERFAIEKVVARIYDPRRAAIYERLGITTIATAQWTIERLFQRVVEPLEGVEWTDPSARLVLVERRVPTRQSGRPTSSLELEDVSRVVAVTRLGSAMFPTPDQLLQDGDLVHLAVRADRLDELDRHLAANGQEADR